MKRLVAGCLAATCGLAVRAQTNQTDAARWLAKAELAPAFVVPASREAWETQRRQVRAELWELLGRLPPRPTTPKVETLSREDRGDYVVEKFQFDNGAGATVPGYLLLPKNASAKRPPSSIATGTAANTRSARRSCFRPGTRRKRPGRLSPSAAMLCWRSTPTASASATAGAPAAGRKRIRRRRNDRQVQSLGWAHVLGHDAARRFDGAGLPGVAPGSGSRTGLGSPA